MAIDIAREWSVNGQSPRAIREAVAQWVALREAENRRAAIRITADDAAMGPDTMRIVDNPNVNGDARPITTPSTVRTASPMADRASLAMPISGVHIMPTFGKGEAVAPFIGSTDSVSPDGYANGDEADAWVYLATYAMGDRFMARVMHVMNSEARKHGRPVDWSKVQDVASEARIRFVAMATEYANRADTYAIRADSEATLTPLSDAECAALHTYARTGDVDRTARAHMVPLAEEHGRNLTEWRQDANAVWAVRTVRALVATLEADTGACGGTVEWAAPREARCGACAGCIAARESESERGASRWILAGCDAPRVVIDWVTPSRVLSRAIWRAAADPTLSTSAVHATRAPYLRKLATDIANEERVNVSGGLDALGHLPDGAAALVRMIAAALEITGDVAYSNRGLSPAARTLLCLAMGTPDTKKGAHTALSRAARLYRPAARRPFIGPQCAPGECEHATCQGAPVTA